MKLNQFIALLKGGKSTGEGALTKAYHLIQNKALMVGYSKTYQPRNDDGETLPSEGVLLQLRVPVILDDVVGPLTKLLDLTATVDKGNQIATADVMIEGKPLLRDVPVSTLLFLEKKLVDFRTFVEKLPTLDAAEEWVLGDDGISWKTKPSSKVRTKKLPRNHEKSPATDKHPAQVEVFYEDLVVGDYTTVGFSGALKEKEKQRLLAQVVALQEAVKVAREQANMTEVPDYKIGKDIFAFLGWNLQ